jgi:tetratricopeptide (TPR) repeat protein
LALRSLTVAVLIAGVFAALQVSAGEPAQPLSPDAAAALVLDSARRGYNEGKFDFAAERFREFLKLYGGNKDAPAAQFGLALSMLELPQKDQNALNAITQSLQQAAGRGDYVDRPMAFYYLGAFQKDQASQALTQAAAKPNEAQNFRNAANQNLQQAAQSFAQAAEGFAARLKVPAGKDAGPLYAADQEWLARCRCEQADVFLRLEKYKEAAALAQALVDDKTLAKNPLREAALYHLGYASFAQRDYLAAGKALGQLAPFQQEFGGHARYLLARIHHLSGEKPEAVLGYKALLDGYDKQKAAAVEAMKNPGALQPDVRTKFDALLKSPPPEHVIRATFYNILLLAEDGKYGEALEGFKRLEGVKLEEQANLKQNSPSLLDEVRLRQGYCLVQVKNFPEALKILQPLQAHPALCDRAMWWSGRAQAGSADPNNVQAVEQATKQAIDLLNRAAEKANELSRTDPEAKTRRGDILLEMGDDQQLVKQYREAAATYQRARECALSTVGPASVPAGRDAGATADASIAEVAMQRQATALHLAAAYKESDDLCVKFEQTYPKSTLMGAVWFRAAENACLPALAAAADPNMRGRRPEVEKMLDEAVKRYQRVLEKYPEFQFVSLARYGLASALYNRGKYAEALDVCNAIPDSDRSGELAPVNYIIADCNIRLFPAETVDALQAAQMIDRAQNASKLLDKFISAAPKGPQAPDALLKLAYCTQRIGVLLIDQPERQKMFQQARQIYERVMQEFPNTPAIPTAVAERARVMALQGDIGGATNEFNRFSQDPLKQSPIAPLALVRMAGMLKAQNRMQDAVNVLAQCRANYESALANDPERKDWVVLLQYEHGLALKDFGKLPEARAIFESIAKQFAAKPEAQTALWRAAQCKREELLGAIAAARAVPQKPGVKPEELAAARKLIEDSLAGVRQTAELLKAAVGTAAPATEAGQRALYEMAWCHRVLAAGEIEAARQKAQAAALEKVIANMRKAGNQQPPLLNPPDVALSAVPVQPSEKLAEDQYKAIIAAAGRSALGGRARLELAEMQALRGQNDAALELLAAALEDAPLPELAERIHLRIGACLLAKEDGKTALARAQTVIKNPNSPLGAEARLIAGEALILAKDFPNAIEMLKAFRDQDPWRNNAPVAARGMLRLSYALAQAQRWDESRQACENLLNRFPQSPWVYEARFGIGWGWQNANQHDNACNAYAEVTHTTAAEVAAKAQLQSGLCRLAQKRFPEAAKELLAVSLTYDYPEYSAQALCEAGQAMLEQKKPEEATKIWQGVMKDYANTKWAETAKQRLTTIK